MVYIIKQVAFVCISVVIIVSTIAYVRLMLNIMHIWRDDK